MTENVNWEWQLVVEEESQFLVFSPDQPASTFRPKLQMKQNEIKQIYASSCSLLVAKLTWLTINQQPVKLMRALDNVNGC